MSKPDIQKIEFPVFGIDWHVSYDNTTIISYCGGGGSARSGIGNSIIITHFTPDSQPYMRLTIDTEEQICVSVAIGASYLGHKVDPKYPPEIIVVAAVGSEIRIYSAFTGRLLSKLYSLEAGKDGVSCVTLSDDGNLILCGCEDGPLVSYRLKGLTQPQPSPSESEAEDKDNEKKDELYAVTELVKVAVMTGHTKAICSVSFRPNEAARAISSAKDGTCREWDVRTGKMLALMECSVPPPVPPPKINVPQKILVRKCSYSPCGDYIYTVASGRRGKAFIGKWQRVSTQQMHQNPAKKLPPFIPWDNYCVSECPVSAMSLDKDGKIIVIGNVEGEIKFVGAEEGHLVRKYSVHDLPVTSIAARPTSLENSFLRNSKKLIVDAISVSADNKMAYITVQTKKITLFGMVKRLFNLLLISFIIYYCGKECEVEIKDGNWESIKNCLAGPPPSFLIDSPLH